MITLIIPYYRQPDMLKRQIEEVSKYPEAMQVIIVDDGSPEPAEPIVKGSRARLYRINDDIPWNRSEARNLGAYVADTDWIIQTDTDHILPVESANALLVYHTDKSKWYRFRRFRVGKADSTRKKDKISQASKFGEIHPHMDSYLITRQRFLSSPYDERYSGCLGGGSPFISRMIGQYGEPSLLPIECALHVYTSDAVKDASITTLSRDTSEYARRRERFGDTPPPKMLVHPWHRVL